MKRIQRNEAVQALRKIIGLTQAEFADMLGVSKDAVVSWGARTGSGLGTGAEHEAAPASGDDTGAV